MSDRRAPYWETPLDLFKILLTAAAIWAFLGPLGGCSSTAPSADLPDEAPLRVGDLDATSPSFDNPDADPDAAVTTFDLAEAITTATGTHADAAVTVVVEDEDGEELGEVSRSLRILPAGLPKTGRALLVSVRVECGD